MSATIRSARPATQLADRLLDALNNPARRERNVAVILLVYVALWTLYAAVAKGSQDIHADMSEQFVLARNLALGYPKHPPLTMLIVRLWFALFPAADWAYYLLAMTNAALALWIAWRLSARFLDGDKRVLGLALLMLVPFFNFHALKFNPNTVLMPLWAATTLFFLRSFETRRVLDAALAGLCAAAAMYGKYWSAILLLGLAIAALADSRRASYFRSPAPWITIMVGGAAIAPHLVWLVANDFMPFSYAVFVHGEASLASALASALGYLLGSLAYVCLPLLIVLCLTRPTRQALADMAWPASAERRLAATSFWATLLLPALLAPLLGVRLTSLWSMSAWTLLPVMLLSSPLVAIGRQHAAGAIAVALALPLVMIAAAPGIGFVLQRAGDASEGHASLLAAPIEALWRKTTARPLKVFGSTDIFTYGVSFYLPEHPRAVYLLERPATAEETALIGKEGVALLCPMSATTCTARADAMVAKIPGSKRSEIEVSRRYLGNEGKSEHYLIVAVPPVWSAIR
jgi:4-amino-4-deoxy-L-arabinose transferase-like glycosyltransferase